MRSHLATPIGWAIALAFFVLPGHAKGNAATARQTQLSRDGFPQTIEVIAGKLKMKVFLHDASNGSEKIPCWTYLTEGLFSLKQREIIFTLQRGSGQKPGDYPREVAEMLAEIFHAAEQGDPMDVGEVSILGDAGFLGNQDVKGIGYIEAERLPGVEIGSTPLLAAILLKNDEAAIAREFGLTRVIALLGKKYRYYPCPPWSDLKRQPVISRDAMGDSILKKVAKAEVRASFNEEHNRVSLRIFKGAPGTALPLRSLGELPPSKPIALLTQVDWQANACVVWPTEGGEHLAISPPNSDGSRKTGDFLMFVPEQNANEIKWYEDGLAILLTNADWKKIREAFLSGSDLVIPPSGKDGASFSLQWVKREYTNPVTGEAYLANEWVKYEPTPGTSPAPQRVSVSGAKIVLLTSDRDLWARTTAEDLAVYLKAIESAVDTFFAPADRRAQRELSIQFDLMPEGNKIQFVAAPDLNADVARQLLTQLESVSAPKVRGPVKLEYIVSIWGVAAKQ